MASVKNISGRTKSAGLSSPDNPVCLIGLGVTGAACAWMMQFRGIPFVWVDPFSNLTAWHASTGAIFPYTQSRFIGDWLHWGSYVNNHTEQVVYEESAFWYTQKKIPQGMTAAPGEQVGALKRHPALMGNVNVQRFVLASRLYFAGLQRHEPPSGAVQIITHGFAPQQLKWYLWGWSARVEVQAPLPPNYSIYCRGMTKQISYLWHTPGTNMHYAGSSYVRQLTPKPLDPAKFFSQYVSHLYQATGGAVRLGAVQGFQQGWRPVSKKSDLRAYQEGDKIILPGAGMEGVSQAWMRAESACNLYLSTIDPK